MILIRYFACLCLIFLCILGSTSCNNDHQEDILVFAAASLTDVLEQLGERFYIETEISANFNFGGSTILAQHIIRGAPADIIITAGPQPLDPLFQKGLIISKSQTNLLTNELVLVARTGSIDIRNALSIEDILSGNISISVGDPLLAPVGTYTRESLRNLGLWETLKPKMILAPDARIALAYVETKAADVGIVYRTDANISQTVQVIGVLPQTSYSSVVYPAVVISNSAKIIQANLFLEFIRSESSMDLFREVGFTPLDVSR